MRTVTRCSSSLAAVLLLSASALFAPIAGASVVIGNTPIDRAVSDGWSNFVLKLDSEVFPSDGVITSWEVFASNVGELGLLVFNSSNEVLAADARSVTTGYNSFASAINVAAGDFLGLWIGGARVDYDYGLSDSVAWCASNGCATVIPTIGSVWSLPTLGDRSDRTYSVRATISEVSAAPEPDALALVGVAVIGLVIASRRRRVGA